MSRGPRCGPKASMNSSRANEELRDDDRVVGQARPRPSLVGGQRDVSPRIAALRGKIAAPIAMWPDPAVNLDTMFQDVLTALQVGPGRSAGRADGRGPIVGRQG